MKVDFCETRNLIPALLVPLRLDSGRADLVSVKDVLSNFGIDVSKRKIFMCTALDLDSDMVIKNLGTLHKSLGDALTIRVESQTDPTDVVTKSIPEAIEQMNQKKCTKKRKRDSHVGQRKKEKTTES